MVRAVFRTIKRFVARHTGIVRMYHEHMRMQNSLDSLNGQVADCLSQLREMALATQRRTDQQTTVLQRAGRPIGPHIRGAIGRQGRRCGNPAVPWRDSSAHDARRPSFGRSWQG